MILKQLLTDFRLLYLHLKTKRPRLQCTGTFLIRYNVVTNQVCLHCPRIKLSYTRQVLWVSKSNVNRRLIHDIVVADPTLYRYIVNRV